jgi:hypothetical protein
MNRLLLLVALVASAAWAVDAPNKSPQPQSFEVSLTVTEKGNELFDSWDHPTGKPFNVEPVKVAPRGKFLSAVVLFKGCQPDASGNCNAVMDIVAYDPMGKTYGNMPHVELWQNKPAPDPHYSQLSRNYMGLVIEPNDISGTYLVRVVARDQNAKTEARSEARFEVK